ncbi:MAG: PLP-dependent aspartate aminotransferase family protein [Dysgonamonadaceae bacterium]|nr:PLP-dependent aspartate aminotransferase family protein [Dysgonamonadaceae bacterium]
MSFKEGQQTIAIHAGESPENQNNASAPPIVMSTTFTVASDTTFSVEGLSENDPWIYTRWGNPTVRQLEDKIAALENAEISVAFSSGMAAISSLLLHLLKAGDHAVVSDVAYAALTEMTNEMIPHLDIEITKVNTSDLSAIEAALRPNTRLVYIETPCNPLLRLTDIKAAAEIVHKAGAKLAVDSTFATPVATKPIELGADFVIHSLTKYFCGHGDALGGAVAGYKADLLPLRKKTAIRLGGTISPFNAWLIMRGIATLPLRMKAHEENALKVAKFLEQHPKIIDVKYPGLPSHPQYELAKQQMHNFSGMLTFQTLNPKETARKLAERLKIVHYAVSLGHHRSLLFFLDSTELLKTTFRFATDAQLSSWKSFAGEGVFRFSVGLENAEDIIADLEQALA